MKRGFTFIEVLVSTIILVIVLAGMLVSLAGGRLISRRSRDRLIAQSFAREKLEELLHTGYGALRVTFDFVEDHDFKNNYANLEFVRRTGAKRYYKIDEFRDDRGRPCYKRVSVVVKWKFLSDVIHTESLSCLIYNPNYLAPPESPIWDPELPVIPKPPPWS